MHFYLLVLTIVIVVADHRRRRRLILMIIIIVTESILYRNMDNMVKIYETTLYQGNAQVQLFSCVILEGSTSEVSKILLL